MVALAAPGAHPRQVVVANDRTRQIAACLKSEPAQPSVVAGFAWCLVLY
jgi:hypothetical protein